MTRLRITVEIPSARPSPAVADPISAFDAGDPLPIAVRLVATEGAAPATRCEIRFVLRCHGSGSPEESPGPQLGFDVPALAEGEEHAWSGALVLPPSGPPSYSGEHVKLDWSVRVTAGGGDGVTRPIWVRPRRGPAA